MTMPLEYVLLTIIQFIVMVLMGVIILRQSHKIASMDRRMAIIMEVNVTQQRLIDLLRNRHRGDDDDTDDKEEVSR